MELQRIGTFMPFDESAPSGVFPMKIVWNIETGRPACADMQRFMGGDESAVEQHFDFWKWTNGPEQDLRFMIVDSPEELAQLAAKVDADNLPTGEEAFPMDWPEEAE